MASTELAVKLLKKHSGHCLEFGTCGKDGCGLAEVGVA